MNGSDGKNTSGCMVLRSFSEEVTANYGMLVLRAESYLHGSPARGHIEASDLLHSALLRAGKIFPMFDPMQESFILWMGPILELRCRAFARTAVRMERMVSQIAERFALDRHKGMRRQIAKAISGACLAIPLQYRKATVMFYIGAHPIEDIATECKTDVRTAEFYIKKGQKALQEHPDLRVLWEVLHADDA